MRKSTLILTGCIIGIIAYFILINIVGFMFSVNFGGYSGTEQESINGGADVKIGVSDSIDVTITRNRFYGKIMESGSTSTLYIFNILKIPLKVNGRSLLFANLILILALIIFIYTATKSIIKNNIERGFM